MNQKHLTPTSRNTVEVWNIFHPTGTTTLVGADGETGEAMVYNVNRDTLTIVDMDAVHCAQCGDEVARCPIMVADGLVVNANH